MSCIYINNLLLQYYFSWDQRNLGHAMFDFFAVDINWKLDFPDHQFYHKWALLTDPDDITGGPKGYLKCDINVLTKGDAVKIPPKSERDEDDIEAWVLETSLKVLL